MPKEYNYNGTIIPFPDDATDEEILNYVTDLKKRNAKKFEELSFDSPDTFGKPSPSDYFRHYVGSRVPGLLSALGGTLGGIAGEGVLSVPAAAGGAFAGKEAGTGLQQKFPAIFGEAPENPEMDAVMEGVLNGVFQGVGNIGGKLLQPEARKKLMANVVASRLFPKGPKIAEISPSAKSALAREEVGGANAALESKITNTSDLINTARQTSRGGRSGSIVEDLISNKDTLAVAEKALKSVENIRDFKAITGSTDIINDVAQNQLLRRASLEPGKFNADFILKELSGPKAEIFNEALGKSTRENLISLANTLKNAESRVAGKGPTNIGTYVSNTLKFTIPIGVARMTGIPGLAEAVTGAEVAVILGEKAIQKFVSSPDNVKLLQAALQTPLKSPEARITTNIITSLLRGTEVMVQGEDGKPRKGYIDDEGKLIYDQGK